MAARKMKGAWWVDFQFQGERIRKKSPVDNKRGAEDYERLLRQELFQKVLAGPAPEKKEVPTFREWFNGRFWREWVIARKNKPSEVEAKRSIFDFHLDTAFGNLALDEVGVGEIARFKANLVEKKLSDKRVNNILAVLSKTLRYAVDAEVIDHAPKVGLLRVERPEIVFFEFDAYARVLAAAARYGREWYAAVCLAGEAGLRVGEVKALRWRQDIDLVGGTVTVNQQVRHGVVGTPKGRTRRTVPMTTTLKEALISLPQRAGGLLLTNPDGSPKTDNQVRYALDEIYDLAELPRRGWHILRHSFGTHAALLGVNPWRLMSWMGHKRVDETMLYVHLAEAHPRALPPGIVAAGAVETDPDRRLVAMLGARSAFGHLMGTGIATKTTSPTAN